METKKKSLFLGILLVGILISSLVLVNMHFVSAATSSALYCAEKTTSGLSCQNVPLSQVDKNYQYAQASCTLTPFCQSGTCVNAQGLCSPSTQTACKSSDGGQFYSTSVSNTPECSYVCCLANEGASYTTQANCNNMKGTVQTGITDEPSCLASSQPKSKGACIEDKADGRTCQFLTNADCKKLNTGDTTTTFYKDNLCSNPTLGTGCTPTGNTECLPLADQVYFVDSCGNQANVYDASKFTSKTKYDTNYWSYVAGTNGVPSVDTTLNPSTAIESATNGNCNYLYGSTCKQYDSSIDSAKLKPGNKYVCRSVNCDSNDPLAKIFYGTSGYGNSKRYPVNGESWCGTETVDANGKAILKLGNNPGVTSSNFSDYDKTGNLPGEVQVLFMCTNGQITTESYDYRSKICNQATTAVTKQGVSTNYYSARWVQNRWWSCYTQNTSANCLDTTQRDCQWINGASILWSNNESLVVNSTTGAAKLINPTNDGNFLNDARQGAACVPKYPPGFDPSIEATSTSSGQNVCGFGTKICIVNYTQSVPQSISGFWDANGGKTITCLNDLNGKAGAPFNVTFDQLNSNWMNNYAALCSSLGDCGVSVNYIGQNGSIVDKRSLFTVFSSNQTGVGYHF